MRKLITSLLMMLASTLACAQYTPYGVQIYQSDATGSFLYGRFFTPLVASSSYFLMYDGTTMQPAIGAIGAGLSWNGTTLSATAGSQVNSDWNASSGLSQILNKPSLATVATSGSYPDLINRPPAPSQSAPMRTLNSAYQISTTRNTLATYSVQITVTASISGGQNGDVILEIASDSGFTTNVQTLSISGSGQTYTLAVAIQGVTLQTSVVSGFVPAGYYARIRTVQNTGTPSFSYRAGQEVLL